MTAILSPMYIHILNDVNLMISMTSNPLWSHPPSLVAMTLLYTRGTESSSRTRFIIPIYHVIFHDGDGDQIVNEVRDCVRKAIAMLMPLYWVTISTEILP